MAVHKMFLEAMERLLLKQFLTKKCASDKWNRLKKTLKDLEVNPQTVEDSCKTNELVPLFHDYENERSELRSGKKGFLPQFWLQHLDRMWLVLDLIKALKENDFNLYKLKPQINSTSVLFYGSSELCPLPHCICCKSGIG